MAATAGPEPGVAPQRGRFQPRTVTNGRRSRLPPRSSRRYPGSGYLLGLCFAMPCALREARILFVEYALDLAGRSILVSTRVRIALGIGDSQMGSVTPRSKEEPLQ